MFNNRNLLFIFIFCINFYLIKSSTIVYSNVIQETPNYHNENRTKSGLESEEDIEALENKKALELYKLIMIFTCCILAILLVCFLICILRNSDVIPTTTSHLNLNDAHSLSDENSINTQTSNNLLINLPFEKPPSYFETLKQIQKEFGHPPPIYTINSQFNNQNIFNQQQTQQTQQINQDELILDCNRLISVNDERSNLELIIANQNREQLRRLSRDLERCYLPNPLNRSHSTPVICLPQSSKNFLIAKNQHLINLIQSPSTSNLINNNNSSNLINTNNSSNIINNSSNIINNSSNLTNNSTDFNVAVDLDELNQSNNSKDDISNQIIDELIVLQTLHHYCH